MILSPDRKKWLIKQAKTIGIGAGAVSGVIAPFGLVLWLLGIKVLVILYFVFVAVYVSFFVGRFIQRKFNI